MMAEWEGGPDKLHFRGYFGSFLCDSNCILEWQLEEMEGMIAEPSTNGQVLNVSLVKR